MLQFNLLPDVKIEYIKTRYRKRVLMAISAAVSVIFFAIFIVLLLVVHVNQRLQLKGLNDNIKKYSSEIDKVEDVNGLLTIQNQLNSLPGLHSDKVVASRLVDYLAKVTPAGVTLSDVNVDYEANTIVLKGNAQGLVAVNKYTDSLKYTEYKVNGELKNGGNKEGKAFKGVVLTSFSLPSSQSGQANDGKSSFTINAEFEPVIFAQIKQDESQVAQPPVALTVPTITSSVSESQKPALFKEQPAAPQPAAGGQQ